MPLAKPGKQLSFAQLCTWEALVHLLVCVFEAGAVESVILPVAMAVARYEYQL